MKEIKLTKRNLLEPPKNGTWALQKFIEENGFSGKVIGSWQMEDWLREELNRQRRVKGRIVEPVIRYYTKSSGYRTPYYYYMKRDIKKVESYLRKKYEERNKDK